MLHSLPKIWSLSIQVVTTLEKAFLGCGMIHFTGTPGIDQLSNGRLVAVMILLRVTPVLQEASLSS